MLDTAEIVALCRAEHGDPYAVLGMHVDADGFLWVRSLQPGARSVAVLDAKTGRQLAELEHREVEGVEGYFEGLIPRRRISFPYRLRIEWENGVQETDDPYRFATVLGEMDVWLLAEGSHLRPFERLGAHLCEIDGVPGTAFAVWAPDAQRVSVVGDFNTWDGRRHPMRLRRECGVWEIFLPGVSAGAHYKYEIRSHGGFLLPLKSDPYGFQAEMRPSTASIVCELPPPVDPTSIPAGDLLGAPMSIYEVHLASWRRADDGGFPDWQRISETLIPYVVASALPISNCCRFRSIRSTAPGATSRWDSTRRLPAMAARPAFAISSVPVMPPDCASWLTGYRRISRPTNTVSAASTARRCMSTPIPAKACIRTGAR